MFKVSSLQAALKMLWLKCLLNLFINTYEHDELSVKLQMDSLGFHQIRSEALWEGQETILDI